MQYASMCQSAAGWITIIDPDSVAWRIGMKKPATIGSKGRTITRQHASFDVNHSAITVQAIEACILR